MIETTFYIECEICEGEGGTYAHCCSGFDDGVPSCGCGGGGTFEECLHCNDGKVFHDNINWDFSTLEEREKTHRGDIIYTIKGRGDKHGEWYEATAIYDSYGDLSDILDVELQ